MKTLENEQEILAAIDNTLGCNDKYKYNLSHYWTSSNSPKQRRVNERKFHNDYPDYLFIWNDYEYVVEHRYDESTKHIHYKLLVFKDDLKTNITALQNIVMRIRLGSEEKYKEYKLQEHSNRVLNK